MIELLKEEGVPSIQPFVKLSGRGVGCIEAPRGLLIHDYTLENGILVNCNIVTPTAQNLDDIEAHLRQAAEDMEFNLEMITRSYDPCISCSAHMVRIKRK